MGWTIERWKSTTYATFHEQIYALKEQLVAEGWRVRASATSAAYAEYGVTGPADEDTSFDLWTAASSAAPGTNMPWIRLLTPIGKADAYELLFTADTTSGAGGKWRVSHLVGGSFVADTDGGPRGVGIPPGPDAGTFSALGCPNPGATDSNLTGFLCPTSGTVYTCRWVGDSFSGYDWAMLTFDTTQSHILSGIGVFGVARGAGILSFRNVHVDADPHIRLALVRNAGTDTTNVWGVGTGASVFAAPSISDTESAEDAINVRATTLPGVFAGYRLNEAAYGSGFYRIALFAPCALYDGTNLRPITHAHSDPATGNDFIFSPLLWAKHAGKYHFIKGATAERSIIIGSNTTNTGHTTTASKVLWQLDGMNDNPVFYIVVDGVGLPWPDGEYLGTTDGTA